MGWEGVRQPELVTLVQLAGGAAFAWLLTLWPCLGTSRRDKFEGVGRELKSLFSPAGGGGQARDGSGTSGSAR